MLFNFSSIDTVARTVLFGSIFVKSETTLRAATLFVVVASPCSVFVLVRAFLFALLCHVLAVRRVAPHRLSKGLTLMGRKPLVPMDDRDANAVLDAIHLAIKYKSHPKSKLVLRWSVDLFWDSLRRERNDGKVHAIGALWSPAALAHAKTQGSTDLVHEHVVPFTCQAEWLLEVVEKNPWTSREDIAVMLRRFPMAVITRDEDEVLNKAGYRQKMPRGWHVGDDMWARYLAVGFDPTTYSLHAG